MGRLIRSLLLYAVALNTSLLIGVEGLGVALQQDRKEFQQQVEPGQQSGDELQQPLKTEEEHHRVSRSLMFAQNASEYDPRPSPEEHPTRNWYPEDVFTLEQRQQGAVILHFIGVVYMLLALFAVNKAFFVPSLGVIIEKLKIPTDVAGATFMAAGGSLPALSMAFMRFLVTYEMTSLANMVGPAVANILFVLGLSSFFGLRNLTLSGWPLFRDCTFYVIILVALALFFADWMMEVWESVLLLVLYVAYVTFMHWSQRVERFVKRFVCRSNTTDKVVTQEEVTPLETIINAEAAASTNAAVPRTEAEGGNDGKPLDLSWPESPSKRAIFIILAPIIWPISLTLPDVRTPKGKRFFAVTFFLSTQWMILISYLITWWIYAIGETTQLPPEVLGFTLLAIASPIPINGFIAARKGLGDMALSSAIGANIFNICLGVGLPSIVYTLTEHQIVLIDSDGLICSAVILFGILASVVLSIVCFRWKLNMALGFIMVLIYVVFVAIAVLFSYRLITCPV